MKISVGTCNKEVIQSTSMKFSYFDIFVWVTKNGRFLKTFKS